jgi:uncharacterized membrane protein
MIGIAAALARSARPEFQGPAPLADAAQAIQTEESLLFLDLPAPWVLGMVVLPATVAFAYWAYGGLSRLEPRTRWLLATLRGLAIAICLLLLFQPAIERVRYTEVRTQVHVLVDDSASMQRRDTYPDEDQRAALVAASGSADLARETRADLVRQVLAKPGGLLEQLGAKHDVRLYRFVRKPLPIRDLGELQSRGPRTHIGDALDLHLATAGAVNLDSLILVSDGRSNAGLDPAEVAAKYRLGDLPIHTVGVGDPNPPRNVRLIGPPGPKDALLGEELVLECTLDAEGLEGRDVTVTLEGSRDGGPFVPLASEQARLGADHVPVEVRIYHAFEEAGDHTLRFSVTRSPEETSFEDNEAIRFLRVADQKIRVLYIDDLPRWEYRYLKNALIRVDPSIVVQCYLCDASKSFVQEHSEELPPLRDIPRSRDELFQYQVILLGDVPPERLAPTEEQVSEWLQLLVEFVESGGGVGFLWGEQAMPESYRSTPLEDLLPVILEPPEDARTLSRDRPFVPRLENPADPHDIVLLRREPENNEVLWHRGFQPIDIYYPVQQAKAGAEVLLRHPDDANRYGRRVVAATSYYPRGHTFFLASDESWKMRNPYGEKWHDRFWRNVVRHLASGRLARRDARIVMRVDRASVDTGGQVTVTVLAEDEEFQPLLVDQFAVFVRAADGAPERRLLRASAGEPGAYEGRFTLDEPGSYSFLAFAADNPAGEVLAREDVLVSIPDAELADSSQDRGTLARIAEASKDGRHVFLAEAASLAESLGGRRPFETEVDRSTRPLWDNLWSLAALLTVLAAEWILRKRARLV